MLEHLTRYFTAVTRLRRSERAIVRSGAVLDLQQLQDEVTHPRLSRRIDAALAAHAEKAEAS